MIARKYFMFLLACVTLIFISCDVEVPIKEMGRARATIELAHKVNAEQYDTANFLKAVDQLKKSHEAAVNKKGGDAKKAAVESANFAELAFKNSLPRATENALAEAKSLQKECEMLNAEQFAPEKYSQTGNAINEAEKLKEDQKLWEAFLKTEEALASGKEAKEQSLAKVPQLNEDIARIKKQIEDLNARNISGQQKQDLATAGTNLDKASSLISQNNIKEAAPLIAESEKTLNRVTLAVQKQSAKEHIAQLRRETEALKKERGTEFAGEDIEIVVTTLNEAEALLDQDKTDEANKKIADAESSLAIAKEKTVKGLAQDKARSVEKLLEDTRKADTTNKYKNETDRAAEMIADGKKLMENESYRDSLSKLNEAEALLYSLGIAGEKDRLKDKGFMQNLEGKMIYKVIYNKKKRDCLWRIAHKVYRNARLWPLIYMANKDQIKDPDLIFPGQKFVIPEVPEKKATTEKMGDETKEPEKNEPVEKPKDTTEEDIKE